MEIKKSHKADLERWRPLMFLAGLATTLLAFFLIMECGVLVEHVKKWEEEQTVDLDLDLKDDRDLIAAAEKEIKKIEVKEAEDLHKVDEPVEEEKLEELEPLPQEKPDEDLKEVEEDPPINMNDDDPETLRIVEELPQYPGGMVEFVKWLTKTLKYPPVALRNKTQGKVIASFIVEKDGSITNIKLENRVNTYLDNEALRVLRLMPKWTPGKDHGQVCRTKVAVPVVFEI